MFFCGGYDDALLQNMMRHLPLVISSVFLSDGEIGMESILMWHIYISSP